MNKHLESQEFISELDIDLENEVDLEDLESDFDEEDDDYTLEADRFNEIVSFTTDWTVETLVSQINKGNILLSPVFQRRNAWSAKKKSQFIESLLLNIPIPNILLGEEQGQRGKYTVIDGKQRLLTLLEFYGYENDEGRKKSFKLSKKIEILTDYQGKGYKQLEKLDRSITNSLDNYPIRTSVLRNIPSNMYLYEIFKRINSGSEKLSPQELRQSKYPGKFTTFLIDKTVNNDRIQRILKISQVHARMKDVELLLRCFASKFFLTDYNNSISKFLDDTTQLLNDEFLSREDEINLFYTEVEQAIDFSFEVFKDDTFTLIGLNREKKSFNRPVFDLMIFYFSDSKTRELIRENYNDLQRFKNDFIEMFSTNNDLLESVSVNTHQTLHTFRRFSLTYDIIKQLIPNLPSNHIITEVKKKLEDIEKDVK